MVNRRVTYKQAVQINLIEMREVITRRELRLRLGLSQSMFNRILNVQNRRTIYFNVRDEAYKLFSKELDDAYHKQLQDEIDKMSKRK